jgi:hypothetical protein
MRKKIKIIFAIFIVCIICAILFLRAKVENHIQDITKNYLNDNFQNTSYSDLDVSIDILGVNIKAKDIINNEAFFKLKEIELKYSFFSNNITLTLPKEISYFTYILEPKNPIVIVVKNKNNSILHLMKNKEILFDLSSFKLNKSDIFIKDNDAMNNFNVILEFESIKTAKNNVNLALNMLLPSAEKIAGLPAGEINFKYVAAFDLHDEKLTKTDIKELFIGLPLNVSLNTSGEAAFEDSKISSMSLNSVVENADNILKYDIVSKSKDKVLIEKYLHLLKTASNSKLDSNKLDYNITISEKGTMIGNISLEDLVKQVDLINE